MEDNTWTHRCGNKFNTLKINEKCPKCGINQTTEMQRLVKVLATSPGKKPEFIESKKRLPALLMPKHKKTKK